MESVQNENVLRHLALIYIALAHGADQDMDDKEADAIVDRLQLWQAEASNASLQRAVGDALKAYTKGRSSDRVQQAVEAIRETVPQDVRQFILEDLMNIALADDKFLQAENTFISELADAWTVSFAPEQEVGKRPWSILSNGDEESSWTAVHDLALIYLTLAHQTDDHLSSEELEAITDKLGEWLPDASDEQVLAVVKEALRAYVQGPDKRVFDDSVEAAKRAVPEHQREAVLQDLQYVASADDQLLEQEQAMIDELSAAWGRAQPS